jgi:GT2 family glycosyltransferase
MGVGGYINNEVSWRETNDKDSSSNLGIFIYDGYVRPDGALFKLRKKLGLDSNTKPAFFPEFGHGRSIGFLPPSGKVYEVEQLMGGVSSFPKPVLDQYKFSEYFEGYGLYEDADFTLRLSKLGKLYVNTSATLGHFHDHSGRPNKFTYGKMVVRNGYYVWRVKHPYPSFKSKLKWYSISTLLLGIRLTNAVTTNARKEAFMESAGRLTALLIVLFKKPSL